MTPDFLAIAAFVAVAGVVGAFTWIYDDWLTGLDGTAQFLPWFGYMGERLRDFEIPAWNPHDASGAPFIGSPATGWLSLPVMICFTLFEAVLAYKIFLMLHFVIGGGGIYAFARRIQLSPVAALVATITYSFGTMYYAAITWDTTRGNMLMYFPVAFWAVESALQARTSRSRYAWAALAALMLSQMYVASGPSFPYGFALIAGWMAYRLLPAKDSLIKTWKARLQQSVLVGIVIGVLSAAFLGSVVLPQLDVISQSPIAGGDYSNVEGGSYAADASTRAVMLESYLREPRYESRMIFYGSPFVLLAFLGACTWCIRYGAPFFAVATLVLFDLSTRETVLRPMLNHIPLFETATGHRPVVASLWLGLPMSLLAAAGTQWLIESRRTPRSFLIKLIPLTVLVGVIGYVNSNLNPGENLPLSLVPWFGREAPFLGNWQITLAVLTTLAMLLPHLSTFPRRSARAMPVMATSLGFVLALLLVAPLGIDMVTGLRHPEGGELAYQSFMRNPERQQAVVQNMAKADPGTAAEFLQNQGAALQPFRHASWNGSHSERYSFMLSLEPGIVGLVTNGRPSRLGLHQLYSYNPVQIQKYVDYLHVMNGEQQDYHYTEILAPALNRSQLFDMLNVRYLVVGRLLNPQPEIVDWGELVYQDESMNIYENPFAFPKAWIVHEVHENRNGGGMRLLASGRVDGREVAYVDGPVPEVTVPGGFGPGDEVAVTAYAPERIEMTARSTAPGLLVVSEIYAKGWNATVDGEEVEIVRTNHALRGVPLAAGEHEVVMTYEPMSLTVGLWSTGLASVAMLGVWAWALRDWRRTRSRFRVERS